MSVTYVAGKPPPVYGAIEYGSDVELQSVKQPLHPDAQGRPGYWPHLGAIRESETSDGMSDAGFSERIELKKVRGRVGILCCCVVFDLEVVGCRRWGGKLSLIHISEPTRPP